ncbi:hypothetical protein SOVF_033100 [Spinacia oleracea]|nr:hypothetical protein SOVF_033100 [Spinacia oleracea]
MPANYPCQCGDSIGYKIYTVTECQNLYELLKEVEGYTNFLRIIEYHTNFYESLNITPIILRIIEGSGRIQHLSMEGYNIFLWKIQERQDIMDVAKVIKDK